MHSRPIHTPSTGTLPIAQVMISLQIPESVRGCPGPGEMTIDRNRLALYISWKVTSDHTINRLSRCNGPGSPQSSHGLTSTSGIVISSFRLTNISAPS
jgi:hypothetical protein